MEKKGLEEASKRNGEKLRNARRNGGDGVIYKQTGTTRSEATPGDAAPAPRKPAARTRLSILAAPDRFANTFDARARRPARNASVFDACLRLRTLARTRTRVNERRSPGRFMRDDAHRHSKQSSRIRAKLLRQKFPPIERVRVFSELRRDEWKNTILPGRGNFICDVR